MTVTQAVDVFHLQQTRVGPAHSWPLGVWEGVGVALGDATGGSVVLVLTIDRGHMYSLEAAAGTKQDLAVSMDMDITWQPQITPLGVAWKLSQGDRNLEVVQATEVRDHRLQLPLSNPYPSEPVLVQVTFDSNVNLVIYRCNMWGYYWDRRAVLTEMGPRRP